MPSNLIGDNEKSFIVWYRALIVVGFSLSNDKVNDLLFELVAFHFFFNKLKSLTICRPTLWLIFSPILETYALDINKLFKNEMLFMKDKEAKRYCT